jgi:hypothetical protein
MTRAMSDDAFEEGRQARLEGRPLDSNPYFGGGKTEAANQLKWDVGWKREHKARRTFSGEADAALRRLLPPCPD